MAKRKRPLTTSQKIARSILEGFFEVCFSPLKTLRFDKPFRPAAPCVVATYHDEMVLTVGLLAHQGLVGIASLNHNGAAAGAVVNRRAGFGVVHGSQTKGGKEAFAELQDLVSNGGSAWLTVDGSRGPRHEMKPGAAVLAKKKQVPLYLVRCSAPGIRLPTWDRFLIPFPFAPVRTHIECIDFSKAATKPMRELVPEINRRMQQLGATK